MDIEDAIKTMKRQIKLFDKVAISRIADNPYKVLVSCLISLRTKDEVTYEASKRLFSIASTPEKIASMNLKDIEKAIYPCGFYRRKSRTIKEASKVIIKKYGGRVPDNIDELLMIKGVGRKTANIVLSYGYGKPAMAVDTHCHRVPNRIGWIKTRNPEETEKELMKIIPKSHWKDFNSIVVEFGRNICKPLRPLCYKCEIRNACKYKNKTIE